MECAIQLLAVTGAEIKSGVCPTSLDVPGTQLADFSPLGRAASNLRRKTTTKGREEAPSCFKIPRGEPQQSANTSNRLSFLENT